LAAQASQASQAWRPDTAEHGQRVSGSQTTELADELVARAGEDGTASARSDQAQ
jgi:hypothetical protein